MEIESKTDESDTAPGPAEVEGAGGTGGDGEGPELKAGRGRVWLERGVIGIFWGVWGGLLLMYWAVSDRTAWGEVVTIWPPMLWLAGLVPLALGMLVLRKGLRWRHLGAALAGLVVFFLITEETGSMLRRFLKAAPSGKGQMVRVVTWNADSRDGATIQRELEAVKPDIVLIQESPDGTASILPRDLRTGPFAGYKWFDIGDCAVLSKWPAQLLETESVGPWGLPLHVRVFLPNAFSVEVINARLMLPSLTVPMPGESWQRFVEAHERRTGQFEKLARMAVAGVDQSGFVIVGGDFNTPAHAASLGPLRDAGLRDAWKIAGRGWGRTILEDFPMARIDQVWVSEGVRVWTAETRTTGLSDHRMVVVDCEVGK